MKYKDASDDLANVVQGKVYNTPSLGSSGKRKPEEICKDCSPLLNLKKDEYFVIENIQVALKTSPYQAAEVGIETRGFMKPDDDIFV